MTKISSYQHLGERYRALRVVGFMFTLIGTFLSAAGALLLGVGFYTLAWGPVIVPPQGVGSHVNVLPLTPWLNATVAFVWSFALLLGGMQMIALGKICLVMIHLEENTRATAQVLDRIRSRLESSTESVGTWFRS
jgi:hypothetical protein